MTTSLNKCTVMVLHAREVQRKPGTSHMSYSKVIGVILMIRQQVGETLKTSDSKLVMCSECSVNHTGQIKENQNLKKKPPQKEG